MRKLFTLLFCIVIAMGFYACKQKTTEQGSVKIEANEKNAIKIHRFDKLLFDSDAQNLRQKLIEHEAEYRYLFNAPLTDTAYINEIYQFTGEHMCKELYTSIRKKYSNLDWLETALSDAFSRHKKLFQQDSFPVVYTLVSANFDYFSRVISTPQFMAISLDMYVIKDFKQYGYFQLANYMVMFLDSTNILPDCMYSWGLSVLPKEAPEKTLLDKILLQGKILYYLEQVLPNISDDLKIRYTPQQLGWCKENEAVVWGFMIQRKLLYETAFEKIRFLVNEGPGTANFPGSPSRLGDYIGWQIVRKYMENTKSSIQELFRNTDSQEILSKSNYKPKRK